MDPTKASELCGLSLSACSLFGSRGTLAGNAVAHDFVDPDEITTIAHAVASVQTNQVGWKEQFKFAFSEDCDFFVFDS